MERWSVATCSQHQMGLSNCCVTYKGTIAIKVISAYHTLSFDVATLFARIPPLYLLATAKKESSSECTI